MTLDNRTRSQMRLLCGEIHLDDGIDPREYFRSSRTHNKEHRKARQLCRQVAETLAFVICGDGGDDLLSCLHVDGVMPAPDTSRLLVTLRADLPPDRFERALLEEALDRQKGRLRCEVAAAITRRKMPMLTYCILGPTHDVEGYR